MKNILLSALSLCYYASFGQWASTPMISACDVTYAFGKTLASEGLVVGTGGLEASSDNGATWAASNTGVPSGGIVFGTNDGTNLYAFRQNSVYVSTTGNNWSLQTSTMPSTLAIKSMCVYNGTVMATASPGTPITRIYHYVGGTWTQKSAPTGTNVFTVIRNFGGTLFAGTTASNVLKSTDGGMTWTGAGAGMPTENCNKYVTALAASGNTLYHGTYGNKLMRSTDNGANWTLSYHLGDNNTFGIGMNDFYVYNANTIFVASDSGFVYTTNGGNSWTRYNNGLVLANSEWNMQRLTVSGNYIVAGVKTMSGVGAKVVRLALSTIGISSGVNELSKGYENKVYPNPGSSIITIEVGDLSFDKDQTISIYDAVGKQVGASTLSHGKANLNVENYAKGIYTFTVSNEGSIASRGKFVVN